MATPPRRPEKVKGTGHAPTAAGWGPGDRPRPHGKQMEIKVPTTQPQQPYRVHKNGHAHCGRTEPRSPATPSWQKDWAQETGQDPTAAKRAQKTGHAPTAAIPGPENQPCPYGG